MISISDGIRKKLFMFGFPILSVAMIGVSLLLREEPIDTSSEAFEELTPEVPITETVITGLPTLASLPPKSAVEGVEFKYFLKIIDSDTPKEQIQIEVITSPTWMQFDDVQLVLSGTPFIGDTDTQEVVLSISDGQNVVQERFYLLILEDDEEADRP